LVVKNNETTIQNTLESLSQLKSKILVADLGCNDETIKICKNYNTEIKKLSLNDDVSQVRNELIKTSDSIWFLQIEPWETIIAGHDKIINALSNSVAAYNLSLFQGDLVTKQIRLWHKNTNLKFVNPVFEILKGEGKELDAFISVGENENKNFKYELVEKWRKQNPLANEPIYYLACCYLKNKNWDAFLNFSEIYLHQEKKETMSYFMTHYYCSMVNCYIKKQYEKAIKFLLPCIAKKPTMAEFWCLLGDVYYDVKDYEKAIDFYENAYILGSKRLKNDDWPMEISKYKEYPLKMMESCKNIKKNQRMYASSI
jgi:tetratricopeptide (TPR) repeat protein